MSWYSKVKSVAKSIGGAIKKALSPRSSASSTSQTSSSSKNTLSTANMTSASTGKAITASAPKVQTSTPANANMTSASTGKAVYAAPPSQVQAAPKSSKISSGGSSGGGANKAPIKGDSFGVGQNMTPANSSNLQETAGSVVRGLTSFDQPSADGNYSGTYRTAAIAMPGASAGKAVAKKVVNNEMVQSMESRLPQVAKNTLSGATVKTKTIFQTLYASIVKDIRTVKTTNLVTGKTTERSVEEVMSTNKLAKWVVTAVGAAFADHLFGMWQKNEAIDKATFGTSQIKKIAEEMGKNAEDYPQYLEASNLYDEVLNSEITKIPFLGGLQGNVLNTKTAADYKRLVDDAMHDRAMAEASGTDAQTIARERQTAEEKKRVDYFNSQAQLQLEVKSRYQQAEVDYFNAQSIYTAQRKAEIEKGSVDYYNEQARLRVRDEARQKLSNARALAAFYEEERIKQAKFDEEERQRVAAYWLEYAKMQEKLKQDNSRSALGFGLMR